MSAELRGNTVHLLGHCRLEDAELLASLLHAHPDRQVDLTGAGDLHTAVLQVLLALHPSCAGQPADPFTRQWLAPLLEPQSRRREP